MNQKITCLITIGVLFFGSVAGGTTASKLAVATFINNSSGHTHPDHGTVSESASVTITIYHHHHAPGSREHQHARIPFAVSVLMDSACSTIPTVSLIHFTPYKIITEVEDFTQPIACSIERVLRPPIV